MEDIHWYPKVKTGPEDPNFQPFDMSPIRPRDDTNVLKHSNHKSSPGPDGVPFGILYHLPSTHHIMATLFNKVIAWGESIIKLTKNKLIDPSFQKSFLPGISGCTEHNAVMEEVIKYVRNRTPTSHIAFFDLS